MGKPGGLKARHPFTEHIGLGRRTQGTETSKYLQERKVTTIPSVAASERGVAQTSRCGIASTRCIDGVVGPDRLQC